MLKYHKYPALCHERGKYHLGFDVDKELDCTDSFVVQRPHTVVYFSFKHWMCISSPQTNVSYLMTNQEVSYKQNILCL